MQNSEYRPYVAGEFVETNERYEVRCPWDNSLIAKVHLAGNKELEQAIVAAEKAKRAMAKLSSYEKYEILMSIANGIKAKREAFARTLALEACKPLKLALGEVDRAIQTFIVAAEEAKRPLSEAIKLDWTPAGKGKEGIVKYFPVGIVAGISPFNFPLNLSVHKIAPAIAAGCPIVLKPARKTPLSALMLAEVINNTNIPNGGISILPTDRNTGNNMVTDSRFSLLSFTGSPQVGWAMKKQAGKKRVLLELGGNAGVIVAPSADIDLAVTKCVSGAFAYSGQVCIHTQRIYVHRSIFDSFMEKFIDGASKLKNGHPLSEETDLSSMIDEMNAARVEAWVSEAINDGAKVLLGGKREGTYFPPTVLTNTKQEMKVCSLEVFGPVVTVEPYDTFEGAIEYLNHSEYGLQAGVFTNQIDEMNKAYNELEVGGVIINDVPTFRVDHMPYGGIKNSGFGREGIKYAMIEMMEPKLLVKPFE
ncbi:aldehyde dehydrogenase family protein [Tenuifilum thalassicum]|uniref:Aldehyde dehydrogenase family protein n=1 Tax=Tenuifilum thalassicum TaxID=2590900 RepID=A0A7D3XF48_9BACT|nr:aldehyde dehydrogenase family protein [Tenuifilum thalassicum]QKG80812.1 aldehyde dehydrogenase family protein [Tenuifilum thalassicum]